MDDEQPPALRIEGEEEYQVEEIMQELSIKWGRGFRRLYEVKWKGYALTTFEPRDAFEDAEALDRWEEYTQPYRDEKGRLPDGFRRGTPTDIHPGFDTEVEEARREEGEKEEESDEARRARIRERKKPVRNVSRNEGSVRRSTRLQQPTRTGGGK